jgi:hypothetical protein
MSYCQILKKNYFIEFTLNNAYTFYSSHFNQSPQRIISPELLHTGQETAGR